MKSDFSSSNDLKLGISGIEGAEGTFPGTGISFQKLASSSNWSSVVPSGSRSFARK